MASTTGDKGSSLCPSIGETLLPSRGDYCSAVLALVSGGSNTKTLDTARDYKAKVATEHARQGGLDSWLPNEVIEYGKRVLKCVDPKDRQTAPSLLTVIDATYDHAEAVSRYSSVLNKQQKSDEASYDWGVELYSEIAAKAAIHETAIQALRHLVSILLVKEEAYQKGILLFEKAIPGLQDKKISKSDDTQSEKAASATAKLSKIPGRLYTHVPGEAQSVSERKRSMDPKTRNNPPTPFNRI